jgi:hypothetical protein
VGPFCPPGSGSGSNDLIESESNPDPDPIQIRIRNTDCNNRKDFLHYFHKYWKITKVTCLICSHYNGTVSPAPVQPEDLYKNLNSIQINSFPISQTGRV